MAQYIPKIIHQTYINESVPEHWREAQRSCIDLHEDYEYKVRRPFQTRPPRDVDLWGGGVLSLADWDDFIDVDGRQVTRTHCD